METNQPITRGTLSSAPAHGVWSLGLLGWTMVGSALAHGGLLAVLSQAPVLSILDAAPRPELRRGDHAVQVALTTRHIAWPEPTAAIPLDGLLAPSHHEALAIDRGDSDQVTAMVEFFVSPRRQSIHDASRLLNPAAQEAQPNTELRRVPRESSARPHDVVAPPAPRVETPPTRQDAVEEQAEQIAASDESTAGVSTGAQLVNLPSVRYPLASRRRGEEGLIVLRVQVRADGSVGRIEVVRDAGHRLLRKAAIEAVRRARFNPARKNGRAAQSEAMVPIRFRLDESDGRTP